MFIVCLPSKCSEMLDWNIGSAIYLLSPACQIPQSSGRTAVKYSTGNTTEHEYQQTANKGHQTLKVVIQVNTETNSKLFRVQATYMSKKMRGDWLAKWLIILGNMGLRRPRASRRFCKQHSQHNSMDAFLLCLFSLRFNLDGLMAISKICNGSSYDLVSSRRQAICCNFMTQCIPFVYMRNPRLYFHVFIRHDTSGHDRPCFIYWFSSYYIFLFFLPTSIVCVIWSSWSQFYVACLCTWTQILIRCQYDLI